MTQQATAQVLPFTPKPPSFGDMLGATKKTEAAPKKGKMPTLDAPPEVKVAVDEYQEAKAQAKQAEAVMDVAGAVITGFVRDRQDADGFAGKFSGSYALMGHKSTAKVMYANKYVLSADVSLAYRPSPYQRVRPVVGPGAPLKSSAAKPCWRSPPTAGRLTGS
jgi:hypothetical protein